MLPMQKQSCSWHSTIRRQILVTQGGRRLGLWVTSAKNGCLDGSIRPQMRGAIKVQINNQFKRIKMKTAIILCLAILLAGCSLDSEDSDLLKNLNFSSESVAACVSKSADTRGYKSVLDVQVLSCSEHDGVFDQSALNDLNIFTNLTTLRLGWGSSLVQFNGKAFPFLSEFRCDDCGIYNLDLSQNEELSSLEIWGNRYLENLDFSHNPKLSQLKLSDVFVLNLILGQQNDLTEIYLDGNALHDAFINLDLTEATALERVEMRNIGIDYLDLSQNINLSNLLVSGRYLENIDMNTNKLRELSITNSAISTFDISEFIELTTVVLYGNQIAYMNLDYNEKLELVNFGNNPLSTDMIEYLESLTWVDRVLF